MRNFIIILSLSIWTVSCKQSTHPEKKYNWTEQEVKKYFIDSIAMGNSNYENSDSLNNFDFFMKTFYDKPKAKNYWDEYIYSLDEAYSDTTKMDKNKKWFRLIVMPAFATPYSITLDKVKNSTIVTFKMTNGQGGHYPGYLVLTSISYFKDTLYDSYNSRLEKINFWKITDQDSTCHVVIDGASFVFEAIDKERYNVVYRDNPSFCSSKEAQELSKIEEDLFKISNAKKFWKIYNHEW